MSRPFSLLDLAPIPDGFTIQAAFEHSQRMAKQAERCGYRRVWLAEHHGMQGVASSATAVVLSHIAQATSTIRIGAGGVMLPNHAPLVVAEQFGTLATLYPNRVDLGLGRAPGTDMITAKALRRSGIDSVDSYPSDIKALKAYLGPPSSSQKVVAIPGVNTHVPLWLLGSSLYSAQLAAQLGLPYSFASHFAPDLLFDALHVYRSMFQPSEQVDEPYAMVGVMVVMADTEEEAQYLFTSVQQQFIHLRQGVNKPFSKPTENFKENCSSADETMLASVLRYAMVGTKASVAHKLESFLQATNADEIIVSMPIHPIEQRLKSVALFSELMRSLNPPHV